MTDSSETSFDRALDSILALEESVFRDDDTSIDDPTVATEDEIRQGEKEIEDNFNPGPDEYSFCVGCDCKTAFGVDEDGEIRHHCYIPHTPSPTSSELVAEAIDLESFVLGNGSLETSIDSEIALPSPSASQYITRALVLLSFIEDEDDSAYDPNVATESEIIQAEYVQSLDD